MRLQEDEEVKARRPRWRRWWMGCLGVVGGLVALVLLAALAGVVLWHTGRVSLWFAEKQSAKTEGVAPADRPWPPLGTPAGEEPEDRWPGPSLDASRVGDRAAFFVRTNVWRVDLAFSEDEWRALQPTGHKPSVDFNAPDGKFPLRNDAAPRNGLAGVMGLGQPWSKGRVTVGGVAFDGVSVRLKGNGTFLNSFTALKKPFKVDLGRGHPGRALAGSAVLNLNNLVSDFSSMSDAMGYRMYREAGVPAPRTAYARVRLGLGERYRRRPLGLYVLVENLDEGWLAEWFRGRDAALFKPVTYELFKDLGTNWSAYEGIYDPKVRVSDAHKARLMEAARFVTGSTDAEFGARVAEFFDLEEVARFVAVTSAIASYDGFLFNGQNFMMYLDGPRGRFGLVPWDLDQAWGEFPLVGTVRERERASIERPWVADHRLLERLFGVESFRRVYRAEMERIVREWFVPARLRAEVRELAAWVRPTVLEESDYRRGRFEEAVKETWDADGPEPRIDDPFRPVHSMHRFIVRRHESLEAQLAGREKGVVFEKRMPFGK
ncbi:MAG: CotH kinase family protein [Verrucomicrobiota bacterium]